MSIVTPWIALYANFNGAIYFDSFGAEHIPKVIKKLMGNKNIITNIYRTKANDSIMCRYFCIAFIDFETEGKSLFDYANLYSPNEYEKNNKTMLRNFQQLKSQNLCY